MLLKSRLEELKVGLGKVVDLLSKSLGLRIKISTHHLNCDCYAVDLIDESALGEYESLRVLSRNVSLWCVVLMFW